MVAEWARALDWRPGGPGFESRCANFASEICNSIFPALPVSFRGDTKSRRSLLLLQQSFFWILVSMSMIVDTINQLFTMSMAKKRKIIVSGHIKILN